MAYLLMFVTLLHLITLAMLFIATMEKVVVKSGTQCSLVIIAKYHVFESCLISLWSPGGCGMGWRTLTYGTTVGSTTSQEHGCAHPQKNLVASISLSLLKKDYTNPNVKIKSNIEDVMFSLLRVASGSSGLDGPLSGLLLSFLLGLPGSAVHHVQGRTLLLHWTVSSLCR